MLLLRMVCLTHKIPDRLLLFEFVPFNSSPAMTTFDLRGLADAIKPLKEICKW